MKTHPGGRPAEGENAGLGRRAFLTAAGLASAGSVAAVAVAPAEAQESPEEMIAGRYRETPHVQRFYFLNRL